MTKKLVIALSLFAVAILLFAGLSKYLGFYQAYTIQDKGMEPNLKEGKTYFASNLIKPERKSIAIYESPFSEKKEKWIQRLVGFGGDTIEFRKDVLYVNGMNIDREINLNLKYCVSQPKDSTQAKEGKSLTYKSLTLSEVDDPVIVPKDHYYFVGDNRNYSFDSRFFGPIHKDQLVGVINTDF